MLMTMKTPSEKPAAMSTKDNSAKMWSLLNPIPLTYYSTKADVHITWWNGIVTTHKTAMMVAGNFYFKLGITPKMKDEGFAEFRKAYHSGAFGTGLNWNVEGYTPASYFNYIAHRLAPHIKDKLPVDKFANCPATVLQWFDKRNCNGEV